MKPGVKGTCTRAPDSSNISPELAIVSPQGARRRIIPLVVAFAFMMEAIDANVLTTSIPAMAADLHRAPLSLHLAITVYTLSLAIFIPVSGWIADRFGPRRVFCAALALFVLGSAACGAAQGFGILIAARALQGLGGAMTTPVGRLILLRSFAKKDLASAMSLMVAPVLIGPLIGPLMGGAITTYASWRWIFYLNLPLGVAGVALTLLYISPDPPVIRRRFDVAGFLLIMLGFGCLQLTIENLANPFLAKGERLVAACLVPLSALLYNRVSRATLHPAIDLSLLRQRTFRIGILAGSLCRIGLNAQPFLLPLLFQLVYGLSPIQSGSITFISALGVLCTRPLMVPALRHLGFRRLMLTVSACGACLVAICGLFAAATPHAQVMAVLLVASFSTSILFNAQNMLIYSDLSPRHLSDAVSIGVVAQQVSMSLGISVAATLLAALQTASLTTQQDFTEVFFIMATFPLAGCLYFMRLQPMDGLEVSRWRGAEAITEPGD